MFSPRPERWAGAAPGGGGPAPSVSLVRGEPAGRVELRGRETDVLGASPPHSAGLPLGVSQAAGLQLPRPLLLALGPLLCQWAAGPQRLRTGMVTEWTGCGGPGVGVLGRRRQGGVGSPGSSSAFQCPLSPVSY